MGSRSLTERALARHCVQQEQVVGPPDCAATIWSGWEPGYVL